MDELERAKIRAQCLDFALRTETRTGYAVASSILLTAETYFAWVTKHEEPAPKQPEKAGKK